MIKAYLSFATAFGYQAFVLHPSGNKIIGTMIDVRYRF